MKNEEVVYCFPHSSPCLAKCLHCRELLCLDCVFSHQSRGHPFKKLDVLRNDLVASISQYIARLTEKLREQQQHQLNRPYAARIEQGLQVIEMCKHEIQRLVEQHFELLREQFIKVYTNTAKISRNNNNSRKINGEDALGNRSVQEFILSKIQFYREYLEALKGSVFRTAEFEEYRIQQDFQSALELIEMNVARRDDPQIQGKIEDIMFPKIAFDEMSLFKIGDQINRVLGFTLSKEALKKANKIDPKVLSVRSVSEQPNTNQLSQNDTGMIASFVEGTQTMFMHQPAKKKTYKIVLKDYTIPSRAKTVVTFSGLILLIGGQKFSITQEKKYSREISFFDGKFNMMKVAGLMKEGRVGHCVICGPEPNSKMESVYIFGGKNTQGMRLNTLQRYDPWTNSVSNGFQSYRKGIAGCSGVCIGTKIYFLGGVADSDSSSVKQEPSQQIAIYDILLDEWESVVPANVFNYLPTMQPVLIPLNSDNFLIVGGARKTTVNSKANREEELWYIDDTVCYYNVQRNLVWMHEGGRQRVPEGVFRPGGGIQCVEGVHYLSVETRRDSETYGPNVPQILKLDLAREKYTIDSFLEVWSSA